MNGLPDRAAPPAADDAPIVAITMGDGAGVGPEVVVGALADPGVTRICRPVVIGDAARLRLAASIMDVETEIRPIESVDQARFVHGVVDVIDLGLLPHDLP